MNEALPTAKMSRLPDLSLPARRGDEASWASAPDGNAPPAALGVWPVSPEEPAKRVYAIADLLVATILAIVLLAVGGLYVGGVIDPLGSPNAPSAPASTPASPGAPGNPFAP